MSKPQRPVDVHRMVASAGPRSFALSFEPELGRCRLTVDGVEVSTWLQADAPGLDACLLRILSEWHAALHLARSELATQRRRIKGGRNTARAARSTVEQLIRAELRRGSDPRVYFAEWVQEYGYTRRQLLNILKHLEGAAGNT